MQGNEKKEAIRKFKEQKPQQGIYAVRCKATGSVWVGSSRNLEATRNRTWFTLRMGSHMDKPMQQEWNEHGEGVFDYEILETLDSDLHPTAAHDLLKEKSKLFSGQLSARELLPG